MDAENHYWWNLGGRTNTLHAVQRSIGGSRTIAAQSKGAIETNRWYVIEIEVTPKRIRCSLDGQLVHDLGRRRPLPPPDVAGSCVRDSRSDDIIVKLVSQSDVPVSTTVDLSAITRLRGTITKSVLTGLPTAENRFGETPEVTPDSSQVPFAKVLRLTLPAHSLTVLRWSDGKR